MQDDHLLKTTFSGRQPLVEDNLRWKTTFGGRWSSVEDTLWWKATIGGRQPSLEGDHRWKTTLVIRRNTTFSGRWPLVEDDLWWWFLPLTVTAKLSPNQNCYRCPRYATALWFLQCLLQESKLNIFKTTPFLMLVWWTKWTWLKSFILLNILENWIDVSVLDFTKKGRY